MYTLYFGHAHPPPVKVWDVRKKTVVQDFKGHMYGVTCCAFSPDETLVLSADVDCVVLVSHSYNCNVH